MAQVTLQPLAKDERSVLSYLDINFRRLSDALNTLTNLEQGTLSVTGSVEIDTGIAEVYSVVASLADAPASGAAFVRAYVVGAASPRDIVIEVYDNSFNLASISKQVTWIAVGK